MTDRKRLLVLICDKIQDGHCIRYCNHPYCSQCEDLADHILADGWIRPPCKVGNVVYSFCDVFGAILPYVIQDFKVGYLGKDRPNYWYWEATSHATETDELLDEIDFDLDDIGKTVFLTKEEAEEKLKEVGK